MQRVASLFGHTRLFRVVAHPNTRRALRAGRTVALAGSIGFAGCAALGARTSAHVPVPSLMNSRCLIRVHTSLSHA